MTEDYTLEGGAEVFEHLYDALAVHLETYGIEHFESDRYWDWASRKLGSKLASRLDRVRKPIQDGDPTRAQQQRFYEFIANPRVAPVVHSLKAGAITSSGTMVGLRVVSRKRILDVGCNQGYLTTWLAGLETDREVIGLDVSPKSLFQARKHAEQLGVGNARFEQGDISSIEVSGEFDAVVETQTANDVVDLRKGMTNIASSLRQDGIFVSVPAMGLLQRIQGYIDLLNDVGLFVRELDFVVFSDLGVMGAYPVLVCDHTAPNAELDLERQHSEVIATIRPGMP